MSNRAIDELLEEDAVVTAPVKCEFITGEAGTGKTYLVRERFDKSIGGESGLLCATTGIAAINLGATTLNSALGYFNTESLVDLYTQGRLQRRLWELANEQRYDTLGIDEVSMLDKTQLDIIYKATEEANSLASAKRQLGLLLTGDFCQLPPIKGSYAFEADCWDNFAANTTRLTKRWRQEDLEFLYALDNVRRGSGEEAAEYFNEKKSFAVSVREDFEGTTIVPTNAQVDRLNWLKFNKLPGAIHNIPSSRWGVQKGEWKNVPDILSLKIGAYVMILANDNTGIFSYANGDCGYVRDILTNTVVIELVRTGERVVVNKVTRFDKAKNPTGSVTYMPVRLAYAATVHKTQGLTLDKIQVDIRHKFFGEPSMMYVALSRVKTPEGIRIVGSKEQMKLRTKVDPKVIPWL